MSRVHYGRKSRLSGLALQQALNEAGYTGVDINYGLGHSSNALNKPEALEMAVNKRVALETMQTNGVSIPKLIFTGDDYDVLSGGLPLVGRPDKHSKGRGFWLCRTMSDVSRAIEGTRLKKAATHFLEYIEGAREFRVHVMRDHRACDQSTCMNGSCSRTGLHIGRCSADKYRTIKISEKIGEVDVTASVPRNHDNGYRFVYGDLSNRDRSSIRKAARQAVSVLGLDFGAVDLLFKDGKPYVLEVNTAPRLTDETADTLQTYVNAFKRYWDE